MTWNASTSQWVSATPVSGVTTINGVSPVTASVIGQTASIGLVNGTQINQVLTWNGSAWVAAVPTAGTVTSVSGTGGYGGLTLSGTVTSSGSLTLGGTPSGTWPISITGSAGSASTATSATTASSVPWSGITSKPTTLSGFGITDAVAISGTQTITGQKTFTGGVYSGAYNFTASTSIFNSGNNDIQFAVNGTPRMKINFSGDFSITGSNASKVGGSNTWTVVSDRRVKENIVSYTKGLDAVMQIQPKEYVFNGKGGTIAGLKGIGVIADEIEQVVPTTVSTYKAKLNPNDTAETELKNFNSSDITWVLVNAVKELKAEVDSLKAQLAAK